MVEINHKIVITGVLSLTLMFMVLVIFNRQNEMLCYAIVGAVALAIGVIVPSPRINDKTGVLIW